MERRASPPTLHRLSLAGAFLALLALALGGAGREEEPRWWKGNTHTHTLWSDGDGAPELVAAWYREHGYDFLVLSDHHVLSRGERWFPVAEGGRLAPAHVDELSERFGADTVRLREADGRTEMRLATLDEVRARFEAPGEFLLIEGEEISSGYAGKPLHVNALNVVEAIPAQEGGSVVEVLQRSIDAVLEQGRRLGRPVLAHVNHPNFGWAITPEELAQVRGERFFEVKNGHPLVHDAGDATRPGTEEAWDRALALRLSELDLGPLYGVATDDAHHYHASGGHLANAGRGWIVVRAARLDPESLLAALHAGDFYASTGVALRDVRRDAGGLSLEIEPEEGVTHVTRFVGTRRGADGALGPIGELLLETSANPAAYRFAGDELYVRATVVSSRPCPNPVVEGELQRAWVQPALPASGR